MLAFLPPAVKTLTPVLSVARDAFEGVVGLCLVKI